MVLHVVLNYIKRSISAVRIYSLFSYYSLKNGYPAAAFWFLMCAISGFLFLPFIDAFEDMAAIYLDPVSHDLIGQDMFKGDD
jgi:hypothetical protein